MALGTAAAEPTRHFPASFSHSQPSWKSRSSQCRGGPETSQEEMLTVLPPLPHLHHPHPLALLQIRQKSHFPSFQFLMFSSNTAGCFRSWKMAIFAPKLPCPPTQRWEEFFFWKPKQTFLYLGLGTEEEGVVTLGQGNRPNLSASPSGPSLSPTTLGVKRGLFEKQKKVLF